MHSGADSGNSLDGATERRLIIVTENGIDLLISQHSEVRSLLDAVEAGPAAERQHSFDQLRELLAVHEAAEELVLRPITRHHVAGGNEVADARMAEENEAKSTLAELEKLDVDSAEFAAKFTAFKHDVLSHAENEEQFEFPALRSVEDQADLATLADRITKAEAAAPTHPHPSAKSTAANAALGPFAALLDRARDALSRR
jgi:iron-sulfur cluster repair protein YtfE (RIC family)